LADNLRYKLSLTLDCLWPHIRWFVSQSGPVWRFNWRTFATSGELAKERRDRPIVSACLIALTVFFVVLFGDFSGEDYFALPKTALQLVAFIPLAVTAGFCEEVVFRGYLLKQFERLTSSTNAAIIVRQSSSVSYTDIIRQWSASSTNFALDLHSAPWLSGGNRWSRASWHTSCSICPGR